MKETQTICINCRYCINDKGSRYCEVSPYPDYLKAWRDFVTGKYHIMEREYYFCGDVNKDGNCKKYENIKAVQL